jgi:hypothetical protein
MATNVETQQPGLRLGGGGSSPARHPLRVVLRSDWPYVLIAVFVFAVTCYRAATTGITYDEAETYIRYVVRSGHADGGAAFGFLSLQRANNHPLNTLLIDVTTLFFPYRELAIRLPNLLMFAVYLWSAVAVSHRFVTRPLVFGLLALNPMLDEFFGLARGYGLAAGVVLMALSVPRERDGRSPRLSLWLLVLACLANYAVVALLAAFCIEAVLASSLVAFARVVRSISMLAAAVVLGFVLYALAVVTEPGKPLVGDVARGFWDPVVGGYTRMFLPDWNAPLWLLVAIGLAFAAVVLWDVLGSLRQWHHGRCLLVLLAMTAAASHLFGRPMPTGRVLLPFWPLVALSIGETVDSVAHSKSRARILPAGSLGVAAWIALTALAVNFVSQVDTTSTREWREDYRRADAVRGPLGRGECVRERDLKRHPVVEFYLKRFGRSRGDPALTCPAG